MKRLRVLVLRPTGEADDLARAIQERGAEPVIVPAIRILPPPDWRPVDRALEGLAGFDWLVFTSRSGVDSFFNRMSHRGLSSESLPARIGAVGPKTKEALEDRGARVDWVPTRYTTTAMAEEFPGPKSRVCLVRSQSAGTALDDALLASGFELTRVDAYSSEPRDLSSIVGALENGVDAIAFTSASIVDAFVEAVGAESGGAIICSIGPATSDACTRSGLDVDVEAAEHTAAGLADALFGYIDQHDKQEASP